MNTLKLTSQFKEDLKRYKHNAAVLGKLEYILNLLVSELWRRDGKLHIYVQTTSQGDGEKVIDTPPTPVYVMEVNDL